MEGGEGGGPWRGNKNSNFSVLFTGQEERSLGTKYVSWFDLVCFGCSAHHNGVHMSQIQWQLHCEVDSVAKGWNAQSLAPTSGDSHCCF